jgi:hypothetical protein
VSFATTDPAWEATKAARSKLDPDDAVKEVSFLQRQYRRQWSNRMASSLVELSGVLRTLTPVRHSQDEGQQPINLQWLEQLGAKVWPVGSGNEILRLVEQVMVGQAISLDSLGVQ